GEQRGAQLVRVDGAADGGGRDDVRRGGGGWGGGARVHGRAGRRVGTEPQAYAQRNRPDDRSRGHDPPAPRPGASSPRRAPPRVVVLVLLHEERRRPARTRRALRWSNSRGAWLLRSRAPHRGIGGPVSAPGDA